MSLNSVGLVRYVSSWAGQRLTIPSMPLKSGFVSNMNVCQRAGTFALCTQSDLILGYLNEWTDECRQPVSSCVGQ